MIGQRLAVLLFFCLCGIAAQAVPFRVLSINVGNAYIGPGDCWEQKLCDSRVVSQIRGFISTWSPDVVLAMEVLAAVQLNTTSFGGPLLPEGYDGICGLSLDRFSGASAAFNASNASHQHECVAWKVSRVTMVPGSSQSIYGRNDQWGQKNCHYDFTAHRVDLTLDGVVNISAVAVHTDSEKEECRVYEINEYWTQLVDPKRNTVISGDWNVGKKCFGDGIYCYYDNDQLQVPPNWTTAYSIGQHFGTWNDTSPEPTAVYFDKGIMEWIDNAFVNFGSPCTSCGSFYNTSSLRYGSQVGGYDNLPLADGGIYVPTKCDHHQLLIDMLVDKDALPNTYSS